MVTNTDILHFAFKSNRFTRKELIGYLENQHQTVSSNAVSIQLNRLVKNHELIRLERGVYGLPKSSQTTFVGTINEEMKQLSQKIKQGFPFIEYCVWSSQDIVPFMHHVPNLNYIYVDVEREVAESVFDLLNNNQAKRMFLCPNRNEFNRYIVGTEAIIVRTLVSEAPLQMVSGVNIPTIEKILVDVVGDVEFDFLQGAETTYFYRNVIERHYIHRSKLLRYATRRGRRTEVEQFINNAV